HYFSPKNLPDPTIDIIFAPKQPINVIMKTVFPRILLALAALGAWAAYESTQKSNTIQTPQVETAERWTDSEAMLNAHINAENDTQQVRHLSQARVRIGRNH
ncbi:hypothetical protein, partial [Paramuribaculum intestinale]